MNYTIHYAVIMQNASMNHVKVFLCGPLFSYLLGKYPQVEFLDHVVTLYLTILGTARLSSKVDAPFYVLTSSIQ